LYVLGIKDCDVYLPTDDEVAQMIKQGQQAASQKQPSPQDQRDLSSAQLNQTRAKQIDAEINGQDARSQLDYMSVAQNHPKVYS